MFPLILGKLLQPLLRPWWWYWIAAGTVEAGGLWLYWSAARWLFT